MFSLHSAGPRHPPLHRRVGPTTRVFDGLRLRHLVPCTTDFGAWAKGRGRDDGVRGAVSTEWGEARHPTRTVHQSGTRSWSGPGCHRQKQRMSIRALRRPPTSNARTVRHALGHGRRKSNDAGRWGRNYPTLPDRERTLTRGKRFFGQGGRSSVRTPPIDSSGASHPALRNIVIQ